MAERRVFKYSLPMGDEVAVALPVGAKVLTIRFQRGIPTVWALVDPFERDVETHVVRIVPTGNSAIDETWAANYVSTDFLSSSITGFGELVFHFFEMKKEAGS